MVKGTLGATILSGLVAMGAVPALSAERITLASTTSVDNSGLLGHILLEFTRQTGISVHVLAQGTG